VIVGLLYPKKCLGCGVGDTYICTKCLSKVKHPKPDCIVCRKPSVDFMTHAKCKKPLSLTACVSAWHYSGVIRKTILALKYKFALDVAEELVDYTVDYLKENKIVLPRKAVLVPVPLHPRRKRWRGFNQAEELGRIFSRKFNWDYCQDYLIRIKNTTPQVKLKGKERVDNIHGVFSVNPRQGKENNAPLIVFDDVSTTGATLKEAGNVLKRNGAQNVWGFTVS
jgi:ComF family protein